MKANFSTTDVIYHPGDFLPSINVIFGDLRRHKVRITNQEVLNSTSWLTDGLLGSVPKPCSGSR
jgi:hypothetical protein